ncbi:hypothetical protein CK203_011190 [Vitis vinifera]|uniref:Uncharacterized protein n=1 Tax=Vitis vinifera TaxID=29760 RepID=A0A438JYC7_VITVI|nr:hypothetical protein CK203_011190 [Vitis vinifera]
MSFGIRNSLGVGQSLGWGFLEGIYGPPLDMERREMWEEFDTSRGLQKDP